MNSNEIDIHKELKNILALVNLGLQEQVIQSLLNRHNTLCLQAVVNRSVISFQL
jgi:hypothetical protein